MAEAAKLDELCSRASDELKQATPTGIPPDFWWAAQDSNL